MNSTDYSGGPPTAVIGKIIAAAAKIMEKNRREIAKIQNIDSAAALKFIHTYIFIYASVI